MATVLQQDQVQRPTGQGYEGQGPEINVPVTGEEKPRAPLQITVPVGDKNRSITEEAPAPVAAPENMVNPDWSSIQKALEEGYGRDEISGYLQQTQKLTPDDADRVIVESVQSKIKAAQAEGYSDDEIKGFLIENRYDGSIIDSAMATARTPKPHRKYQWDPNTKAEEVMDAADLYHNIHDKYSNLGKQIVGAFDEQTGLEARRDIDKINATISTKLNEKGFKTTYNPVTDDLEYEDEQGNMRPVDSSFMNGVFNSKGEIAGGVSGAIAGARGGAAVGAAVGSVIPGVGTGIGAGVGAVVGGVGGGAVGAMAGRGADMVLNSYMLKEQLEADLAWTQMKEAGIADVMLGVVGAGVLKLGKAGLKQTVRAYDLVLAGNSKGAYSALLENMLIDESQAKEIVSQWEQLAGRSAPGKNFREKAISIITTTQQGGDVFLQPSVGKDVKLANVIVEDVSKRAKGLYKAIDELDANGAGELLRNDLIKYKKDVEEFYGLVKSEAGEAIDGTDFRFDMEKLAVRPALDAVAETITDLRTSERFAAYLTKIDSKTGGRTFSDLIDLRQTINQFKYSTSKLNKRDREIVDGALKRVDSLIGKAANEYMDNPKDWLDNWAKAKSEYSKMKVLEGNLLFKAITKKGATEETIARAIKNNINALDGTFDQVLDKLPPATRVKTEAAVIKIMTDKFSIGNTTDLQATHFPMLSESLKGIDIKTPEARRLVKTIDETAKVFKNDINLGQLSGRLTVPQFQSYLTTDPVMRAKFEVASSMFNWLKRMTPSKEGNNLALVNKVSKLLENPLNARTAEDFIKGMPKESQTEMRSLVKELQLQWGKQPVKPKQDFVKMYKQTKTGKLTATDGAWGKGVYLVPKVANPLPDSKVVAYEVNMSRMATFKDLSNIVASEVTPKNIHRHKKAMQELIDRGYLGLMDGDRVMLFPETTRGVSSTFKAVPEREWPSDDLLSGTGAATKSYNSMNAVVKNLKDGFISEQTATEKASNLGFTLYKHTDGTWKYKPERAWPGEGRIVSRYAPAKENASSINPGRNDFNYVTDNEEILGAYGAAGGVRNDFLAPKDAKILDLSDENVAKQVFQDIFKGKLPSSVDDLEDLMHDLHEGALNKREPGWTAKLKAYMKKNGYQAQSYNGEEAWLPGVLKDK